MLMYLALIALAALVERTGFFVGAKGFARKKAAQAHWACAAVICCFRALLPDA